VQPFKNNRTERNTLNIASLTDENAIEITSQQLISDLQSMNQEAKSNITDKVSQHRFRQPVLTLNSLQSMDSHIESAKLRLDDAVQRSLI
jgi:hypothetical protein